MTAETNAADGHDDIIYPSAIPFVLVHLGCFAAIWSGVTWSAVAICVTLYWLRMFAIGAGYHRYFSHRAYSTSRVVPVRARRAGPEQRAEERPVVGLEAPASSPAFRHRGRRAFAAPQGLHLQPYGLDLRAQARQADLTKVGDLTRYPELMWLHKFELAAGHRCSPSCAS